ncbi:hypothetical protein EB796_020601 [Bugula neritina]|uniref:Uncharacterized protein n=1 Tax=Bugula neritina TaxID=10212 RepID=A0A7J7J5U5_BUGNE|nr:hypothetical protein EB796_020601 [Bugula neritina]
MTQVRQQSNIFVACQCCRNFVDEGATWQTVQPSKHSLSCRKVFHSSLTPGLFTLHCQHGCSDACNARLYLAVAGVNTQVAEQSNSRLNKLRGHCLLNDRM